jgi:hypothetical protein
MPFQTVPSFEDWTPAADPTPGQFIIAISKTNPGIVTIDGTATLGFGVGDPVYVSGIGGMVEINNRFLTIGSIAAAGGNWAVTLKDGGVDVNTTSYSTYTGGGTITYASTGGSISTSGVGTCRNNLFDDGAFNTIAWSAVPGAQRYNVYKDFNGLFGYIGQTQTTSFVDDNIGPDISRTPPLSDNPFNGAGKYPGAVGYFEQRRCFAGPDLDPAYFWATRSGTEANLSYSIPGRDDDSIRFRIAARKRTAIRHILPMATLVLLSDTSEWRVAPSGGEVLTPDVSVKAQSHVGANNAQPVLVNNSILFAAAMGGHVREMSYSWQANNFSGGYLTGDLCLRAPHLFDGFEITEMAYAQSPFPIVWSISTSGKLLGITYVPEEEVGPWHQHDTQDGVFESICAIPENGDDVLYAVIRRTTAAGDQRYIERMEPRRSQDGIDGYFVDCGIVYDGAATTAITGLDHLEGKSVVALADGGVVNGLTVTGGAVTLPNAASLVYVGLPITSDITTLPIAIQAEAFGQGRPKNVNEVWLRFYASRGIYAGPSFTELSEYKPRSTEAYNAAPSLINGEIKLSLSPSWSADGQVCLRHADPLPLTLVSVTLGFAVGG